jgi:hypothetical protein
LRNCLVEDEFDVKIQIAVQTTIRSSAYSRRKCIFERCKTKRLLVPFRQRSVDQRHNTGLYPDDCCDLNFKKDSNIKLIFVYINSTI